MTKWTKLQCPRSHNKPDLFIYFILSTSDVLAWFYVTWQPACDKATPCQDQKSHFLITSCVLCDTDDGKHEQLFQ